MLTVNNLRVAIPTHHGAVEPVRGVSFAMQRGDTVGLVGESGCGKSMTALTLMGLQPERAQVSGSIQLHGQELVGASDVVWRELRGRRVAMVFQEPMSALNPLHTVGHQIAESLRLHMNLNRGDALAKALRLLEQVGIPHAADRLQAYPHQFSGGQRQRILIAMALACGPDLLIADEPTTALDVTVAADILALLRELITERGMGLILISHDLGVVARHTERLMVMYGGQVVESGPTAEVFKRPAHPYTRGLLASRPALHVDAVPAPGSKRPRLPSIPGTVPELHQLPPGCPFAGRCAQAQPACATTAQSLAPVTVRERRPRTASAEHRAACMLLNSEQTIEHHRGQDGEMINTPVRASR